MATDRPTMPASYDTDISREPEHEDEATAEARTTHEFHAFGEYESCPICKTERAEEEAAREHEHAAAIDFTARAFQAHCTEAETALSSALRDLTELCGPLFDIEYAEGSAGYDAQAELANALRGVRHARRIADARVKMLEG